MSIIPERSPLIGDPMTARQKRDMWREEYRQMVDRVNRATDREMAEAMRPPPPAARRWPAPRTAADAARRMR